MISYIKTVCELWKRWEMCEQEYFLMENFMENFMLFNYLKKYTV